VIDYTGLDSTTLDIVEASDAEMAARKILAEHHADVDREYRLEFLSGQDTDEAPELGLTAENYQLPEEEFLEKRRTHHMGLIKFDGDDRSYMEKYDFVLSEIPEGRAYGLMVREIGEEAI
jgi:hypothetical protein